MLSKTWKLLFWDSSFNEFGTPATILPVLATMATTGLIIALLVNGSSAAGLLLLATWLAGVIPLASILMAYAGVSQKHAVGTSFCWHFILVSLIFYCLVSVLAGGITFLNPVEAIARRLPKSALGPPKPTPKDQLLRAADRAEIDTKNLLRANRGE